MHPIYLTLKLMHPVYSHFLRVPHLIAPMSVSTRV